MVRVNCAAIPSTLIESELFGRERGAFTDAIARQVGRFELADRSTIFLDEIGDLPSEVQVKLLRVLEDRRRSSGWETPRASRSTSGSLPRRIAISRSGWQPAPSASNLFYRLNVFPIRVPPLRERAEDIPDLVWHFIREFSEQFGKRIDSIAPSTGWPQLTQYPWPGNIRELRNVVERAMVVAGGPQLSIRIPSAVARSDSRSAEARRTSRRRTSIKCWRAWDGAFEALAARPIVWACGQRPWRPG